MWAVGENCVAAMKFEISGFTTPGARFLHTFLAQVGLRPPSVFFSGGFAIPGRASLGKILHLNPENPTTPWISKKITHFCLPGIYNDIFDYCIDIICLLHFTVLTILFSENGVIDCCRCVFLKIHY